MASGTDCESEGTMVLLRRQKAKITLETTTANTINKEELVKEFSMELAIENLMYELSDKINSSDEIKNNNFKSEIMQLINDREEIYNGNKEIIKKYAEKENRRC